MLVKIYDEIETEYVNYIVFWDVQSLSIYRSANLLESYNCPFCMTGFTKLGCPCFCHRRTQKNIAKCVVLDYLVQT